MGTSVTVKVEEINEKIREGESKSMRKEMVSFSYLSHIAPILFPFTPFVVSACLLHGVNMVNYRKGILRKSHTRIDNFVPLIRISTL